MKRILIILSSINIVGGIVIVPTTYVINQFKKSLNSNQPHENESFDPATDEQVRKSNQGFLNVDTLMLNTQLGEIDVPTETVIIESLKSNNEILNTLNIYVKSLTLKQAKFTVENYTGTLTANYKINSLHSLVAHKNLGKIVNIRQTTIIEKIKEKNSVLSKTDFSSEIALQVLSLTEISMDWIDAEINSSTKIILNYEVISLEGLFLNNNLGKVNNISENAISTALLKLNPYLNFLSNNNIYQIKIANPVTQTPESVRVHLFRLGRLVDFEGESSVAILYNTKNIAALINNLNLGVINKVDYTSILKQVTDNNPVYANFRNLLASKIIYGLESATVSNDYLDNQVVVKYDVKNIAAIVDSNNLGNIINFPNNEKEMRYLFVKKIKEVNSLFKYIGENDFTFSPPKINIFDEHTSVILDNKVTLKIAGLQGLQEFSFNIVRQNINTFFKTTNLGKFYWVTKQDIVNRIKETNGTKFNENEINYLQPNYSRIILQAKPNSFNYYGEVEISYETNFKKTTDHSFAKFNHSKNIGETVNSYQFLEYGDKTENLNDASFEFVYAIPNGLDELRKTNKTEVIFTVDIAPTKVSTGFTANNSELNKYKMSNINMNISLFHLKENQSNWSLVGRVRKMPVKFRSYYWFTCSGEAYYNLSSDIKYNYWVEKAGGNKTNIYIKLWITSTLDSWSNCDRLDVTYTTIIKSIDIV